MWWFVALVLGLLAPVIAPAPGEVPDKDTPFVPVDEALWDQEGYVATGDGVGGALPGDASSLTVLVRDVSGYRVAARLFVTTPVGDIVTPFCGELRGYRLPASAQSFRVDLSRLDDHVGLVPDLSLPLACQGVGATTGVVLFQADGSWTPAHACKLPYDMVYGEVACEPVSQPSTPA